VLPGIGAVWCPVSARARVWTLHCRAGVRIRLLGAGGLGEPPRGSGYDQSYLGVPQGANAPAEGKDDLVRRVSLLKRNAMAAPFEQAFDEFHQLQEEASKYTSEAAPQGIAEGGETRAIHYREEEAIYVKASHDRVTVIFSTVFREETDRIFGKVFLQEFVDARRRAIQNAPQVLFRNEPPLELQGFPGISNSTSGEIGYITFGKTKCKSNCPSIDMSSSLSSPLDKAETRRSHLPHSDLP
jgi:hypothetical protein